MWDIAPEIKSVNHHSLSPVSYTHLDVYKRQEYECSCGMGVAEEYKCCPYCGAELAWEQVRRPSKEFRKLLDKL